MITWKLHQTCDDLVHDSVSAQCDHPVIPCSLRDKSFSLMWALREYDVRRRELRVLIEVLSYSGKCFSALATVGGGVSDEKAMFKSE